MRKRKKGIVIIVVLLLAAFLLGRNIVNNLRSPEEENGLGIPTQTVTVERRDLTETIRYLGTIEAKKTSTLSPKVTASIRRIYFDEGDQVEAGAVLVQMDDRHLEAAYSTTMQKIETLRYNQGYLGRKVSTFYDTNPNLKKLESIKNHYDYLVGEVEKYQALYDSGAVPREALDKIKHEKQTTGFQLEELEATISNLYAQMSHERDLVSMQIKELEIMSEELKLQLEETVVTAPFSGKIRQINYNENDLYVMGTRLLILDDVSEYIITTSVGELDLAKLELGGTALVRPSGNLAPLEGKISAIAPSVNPMTRIGKVEVSFPAMEKERIFIGASAQVDFIVKETKDTLVIDTSVIKQLGDRQLVYVLKDDHVEEREIVTGLKTGNDVQVLEGLSEREIIAVRNIRQLYDGAKVYLFRGVDDK